INLYHSMMDKEGTDGEHVLDGASSALINKVDAMLQKLEKDIDDVHAMIGDKRQVLDRIKNDDKMIQSKGGVDALSEDELGEDCRERGMLGLHSVEEMRQQIIVADSYNGVGFCRKTIARMTEKEGTDIMKTYKPAHEETNDSTIPDAL
ncbi:mitochondrial proton/calcium exchanger protein-like protein, partial [Tanacetum coccineum]